MNDEKETGRLEAFSDGVFAVAITLLVLNIKTDDANLWNQWPTLLGFVTSFITVGIMWLNHHRLFTHIRRIDTMLILLNLLLLMVIVFVPVPTALLARFLPEADQPNQIRMAALAYSGTFLAMAVLFTALWRYATYHNRLLGKRADIKAVQGIDRQYFFGPALYMVCVVLAWLYVPASLFMLLALAIFFALPGHALPQRGRAPKEYRPDEEYRSSGD
ncbi:MAG TPA: TMEM175 family protein [Ktedonobacteraceae bacterium]|nr:TMEM175 family protein [Ktedonobacteraceae bacterium]